MSFQLKQSKPPLLGKRFKTNKFDFLVVKTNASKGHIFTPISSQDLKKRNPAHLS